MSNNYKNEEQQYPSLPQTCEGYLPVFHCSYLLCKFYLLYLNQHCKKLECFGFKFSFSSFCGMYIISVISLYKDKESRSNYNGGIPVMIFLVLGEIIYSSGIVSFI